MTSYAQMHIVLYLSRVLFYTQQSGTSTNIIKHVGCIFVEILLFRKSLEKESMETFIARLIQTEFSGFRLLYVLYISIGARLRIFLLSICGMERMAT